MITLQQLGIVQGSFQITSLSQPFDNPLQAFQQFLANAEAPGTKLRTIIYGCTLKQFFDGVIEAKRAGCDVKVLFDHTQAAGRAEKPEIEALVQAGLKDGVDFLIGTSPEHHQILHQKATTIWAPSKIPTTLLGSWNYSESASYQANNFVLIESEPLAQQQEQLFNSIWDFVNKNEQSYQATI